MASISYEILSTQSGIETVPGTAVPALKKFPNLSFIADLAVPVKTFKAQGQRASSTTVPGRTTTPGTIKGPGDYVEGPELCSMIVSPVVTAMGASGGTLYTHTPSNTTLDVPKTRTFEWGDGQASRGYRSTYTALSGLSLKTTPESWEWDGKTIGRGRVRQISLTGSPTYYPQNIIVPNTIAYYFANSWLLLESAVPLTHCFGLDVTTDGWWVPNKPADRTQPSFLELLPGVFKGTGKLKLGADTDSYTLEDALLLSTLKYFRVQAVGALIGVLAAPANPAAAPTGLSASGSGSAFTSGVITVGYTYTQTGGGETMLSPTATITVTAGQNVTVNTPAAVPPGIGVQNIQWYVSQAAGAPLKSVAGVGPVTFTGPGVGAIPGSNTTTTTNIYNTAQVTFCANVSKPGTQSNVDGALADDYDLEIANDPVSARLMEFLFINTQAAL